MASSSRVALENWLKTIEAKGGKVLDIGGSTNPVIKRLKSFQSDKYVILDNNNEKEFHQEWKEPDIIWDINHPFVDRKYESYFDTIFMIEVSEYLYDPFQVFENIKFLLKDGGEFYFSTHFVYPWHEVKKDDCLRYTQAGVEKMLKRIGFKNIEVTPRHARYPEDLFGFYSSEGMRVAKGEDHGVIGHLWRVVK